MLKPAIQYQEELTKLLYGIWFEEKYKFYIADWYCSTSELKKETWNKHEFVSVDKNGKVIGYIDYWIDRSTNKAQSLCIASFTDTPTLIFGQDIHQAIDDIFCKFNFNKLNFCVIIGNPIEKTYDRLIKKYGGTICGYKKENVKLFDGKLYDMKDYEIMREDYLKCKSATKKQ